MSAPASQDHLLILCDGLAAALNGATLCLSLTAAWQDDPGIELTDAALRVQDEHGEPQPSVWVVDFAELREKHDGVPIEDLRVSVIVQYRIDRQKEAPPATCRKLSQLVAEITAFCRKTAINILGDAAICWKTDRDPARVWNRYHEDGLYQAEIMTSWRRVDSCWEDA